MLKCVKYCAMVSFLSMLLVIAMVSPASAATEAVATFADSSWTNVIYYLAELSGYHGILNGYNDDITIDITAVDEYVLYVNGVEYSDANDGDYTTVDRHTVNVGGANSILVGVKVTNHGLGLGNGLIVDIDAGEDQLGTTTMKRKSESIPVGTQPQNVPVAWWTFDENVKNDTTKLNLGDDDWYNFDGGWFSDTNYYTHMNRAYKGEFKGEMQDISHVFSTDVEVIAGYLHTDVDIGYDDDGGIALRNIEGENIAQGQPAEEFQMVDGDLGTQFVYQSNVLNNTKKIDLGKIYKVNKMTVFTGGDPKQFDETSFRGYSVEISLDDYRWEEVGIIHDIGLPDSKGETNPGGYDNYSVDFPPEWARYVRYKITETRVGTPQVAEVMVFGQGYVLEAEYVSSWQNFGSDDTYKNFGMVSWTADQPDGTEVIVMTQTKNGADSAPSTWAEGNMADGTGRVESSFMVNSPEPATHFRYKVVLKTDDILQTPVFRSFVMDYSPTDQPVSNAVGYITPNEVAMGDEVDYVYSLKYDINSVASLASQNIKEVAIAVPGYSVPSFAYSLDANDTLTVGDGMAFSSTVDTLYITFDTAITDIDGDGSGMLNIGFSTKLLKSAHTFEAFISNSAMNDGAGAIKVWENASEGSNAVVVTSLIADILSNVQAVPKVFTPNGDGKNDFTVIQFTLAKVSTDITLKIYSPSGSLVSTVLDGEYYSPSEFDAFAASDAGDISGAMSMPGYWDGTDEDNELVPPGIYLYQVIADTDEGNVIENGSVVVAY